ncbi:MAG: hypothetical protein GC137_01420 [Alphaproteobacteria bacterium]|nr:hypothetical protein [Alphaproteobacteria bacterium]
MKEDSEKEEIITCPNHVPGIYLEYDKEQTEYIRTITSKVLSERAFVDHAISSSPIIGIAGGEVGTRFDADFKAIEVGNDQYCLNLRSVRAVLFSKPKVAIAREFIRGSCEYSRILHHELKHVKILERAHKEYLPLYKNHIGRVAYELPVLAPTRLVDVNTQKEYLVRQIQRELVPYVENMMRDIALRQKEIDTPEEYQEVYSKCERWEQKLGHSNE